MQIGDNVRVAPTAQMHPSTRNWVTDKVGDIVARSIHKDWAVQFYDSEGNPTIVYAMWEHDLEIVELHDDTYCPACGVSPIEYCQGHGEIGDPVGYAILQKHENGDHSSCYARMQCEND